MYYFADSVSLYNFILAMHNLPDLAIKFPPDQATTDPPDPGEPITVPLAATFVTIELQELETDYSTPPRKRI